MAHLWRDIDWQWRGFDRQEKAALSVVAVGLVATVFGLIWSIWSNYSFWAYVTLALGANLAPPAFNVFANANRRRQGIVYQYDYEPRPGRPISIGALQAILAGGLLALGALLGLLIWIAR